MAELAAVGVASSILQIVLFSISIFKTTTKLISDSQDALREEIHLEALTREQAAVVRHLGSSLASRAVLSVNEQAVVDPAREVRSETTALLDLLAQFKSCSTDCNLFKRSVDGAETAWKIHRKKKDVEERRKNLKLINGRLAMTLLMVQRFGQVCLLFQTPRWC
jgi:hypothetical protein